MSLVSTQVKCARLNCPNMFQIRGPKKYCSRRCSKAGSEKLRRTRHPEILRASRNRRRLRYRATHPEWAAECDRRTAKAQTRKRRKISEEEFEAQIVAQGHRCPIGNHEFSSARGLGANCPARDHCHVTNQWRAILCSAHNRGLGLFHDSPEELESATVYIRDWRIKHLNFVTNSLDKSSGTR